MKLVYFNLYARGEPIRMLLWKAGVKYEDHRVSFEMWKAGDLKLSLPNKQMPVLVLDDGTTLSQAHAIMHFLSGQYGFSASNPKDMYTGEHIYARWQEDFILRVQFKIPSY